MRTDFKKTIKTWAAILAIVLVSGYAVFQARNLISGPKITIHFPLSGETLKDRAFIIKGRAKNISNISLNDSPIFVDERGDFTEKLIAPAGYSVVKIEVIDRFQRSEIKYIEVLLPEEKKLGETRSATLSSSPPEEDRENVPI